MGERDGETADPATMPWRDVLSLILSSSHGEDHEETARLCRAFLEQAAAGAAGDNNDVPPADVVATVRTTYVRSLLNAEEYVRRLWNTAGRIVRLPLVVVAAEMAMIPFICVRRKPMHSIV